MAKDKLTSEDPAGYYFADFMLCTGAKTEGHLVLWDGINLIAWGGSLCRMDDYRNFRRAVPESEPAAPLGVVAQDEFCRWLREKLGVHSVVGRTTVNGICDKAVEIFSRAASEPCGECETYKKLYRHAIDCVDRVFQVDSTKPPPTLPDFLHVGEDKFDGVVQLAESYKSLQIECERLQDTVRDFDRIRGERDIARRDVQARNDWARDVTGHYDIPDNGTDDFGAIAAYIKTLATGAEPEVLVDWLAVVHDYMTEPERFDSWAYLERRYPTLASLPTKPAEPPKPAMPESGPPKIGLWRFVATGHEFYGIETQNGIVCEFRGQLFVRNHSINELDRLDPEPKEAT